ncbi:hypothetical protein TNCV_4085471 [Trichonephila clavipes]|nr:hypothetical protein TNCV_4085471 [Trichonephila clavipes]
MTLFLVMAAILKLTTSVIELIRRTLDAIHNADNQDLYLIAHLLGPVRKTKTCDLRGRKDHNYVKQRQTIAMRNNARPESVETLRLIISTRVQLQVDRRKQVFSNQLLNIGNGEVELLPNT